MDTLAGVKSATGYYDIKEKGVKPLWYKGEDYG